MATNEDQNESLLLVDDNTTNLQVLHETLVELGHKILIAKNGENALSIAKKVHPTLILLDIMMPDMDGYDVCEKLKTDDETRHIPVIFLTALGGRGDEAKGLSLGAVDYITKPFEPELVRARVRNHLELARYRSSLEKQVEKRSLEVALTQAVLIESLATLAEYRDPETGGHIKRTQNYVKAMAIYLKDHPRFRNQLNEETIEWLYISAPLHDMGKVGVRDHILLKPGRLTETEFEEMKKHTIYGHDALRVTERKLGNNPFLKYAKEIALSHQEKWDGSGYPQGLKEEEIPLSGRLMALADVYDALISKRVYKPPFSHEEAVNIIKEGSGSHFDPDIVDAFLSIERTFRKIALTYADFDEEREMLTENQQGGPESPSGVERILVVDDNEINREIMRSQLRSLGYDIETAFNGKDALTKYQQDHYDVVLTDLEMPEMDGYALVTEVRRIEKASGNTTPIFAITASDYDLTAEKAQSLGFDGYMLKPLDLEVFKKKLTGLKKKHPDISGAAPP